MIFVRRKGPQSTPSPEIPEEAEEAEIGEEEANVGTRSEPMEEASTSRGCHSKLDELITEFEEFKAQTQMNFEAIYQQLQSNQAENLSNFGSIVKLLEGIQVQIQAMQRQPSPPHDPEIQSPIPTTPQNLVLDDCGNKEPVAHDASQRAQLEDDVQMGEPEH